MIDKTKFFLKKFKKRQLKKEQRETLELKKA